MREQFCSSGLFTARASIIGVIPSVQVIPACSNVFIIVMSMKSTPSGWSFTPASSRSSARAFVNFSTCIVDAGPAAPLIHAKEWRTFSWGIHGECALMWIPRSPCS